MKLSGLWFAMCEVIFDRDYKYGKLAILKRFNLEKDILSDKQIERQKISNRG